MFKFLAKKSLALISIFSLFINLISPVVLAGQIYAQEVISSPAPVVEEVVTPSTEPAVQTVEETPAVEPTTDPVISEEPIPTEPVTQTSTDPAAQESASPAPAEEPTPFVEPSTSPVVEAQPSPSVALNETPQESTSAIPLWQNVADKVFTTSENVTLNNEYTAPQNDKVKVKFTKLPDPSGTLTIKEVKLTAEEMSALGAFTDTAYEITSTMTDGTFEYDVTLPLPVEAQNTEVEVKAAETEDELPNATEVTETKEKTQDTITIKGLNHFTVFIVTAPSPDTVQPLLINEVVPNPSAGAEWVEFFNNSAATIDLAVGIGWTIENSAGNTLSLSGLGTVLAGGRVVFDAPVGWLSNTGPETITLSNETGTAVDTITISLTAPGFAVNHYPVLGEAIGRRTDGHSEWIIFTVPTRGAPNTLAAPGVRAVASTIEAHGYPTWYADDTGTRVAACLDGQDPNCVLAAEPGFDPGQPSLIPNFPSEFFYWSAEALMDTPGGGARLVLADEGAFMTADGSPAEGQQMVFGRIRVRANGLTPNSAYTITHPYGSVIISTDGTGELRSDGDDIGCEVAPCDFGAALASPVFETFLRWDADAPAGYLGDGVTEHTVTGSPTGNNFFRIAGPGLPGGQIETNLFAVLGKLFIEPVVPPPGCVDTAPDAPVLASPANGATGVAVSPILSWNGIAGFGTNCLGNTNQFEVFLDSGNVDPTTSFGSVSEATLSKLIIGLASNTIFSWKVRASNGALFSDSPVQTFTTAAAVGGRAVSPNFDADNGYPTWYRDDAGIMIVPCLDGTDPRCVLPGAGEEPEIWDPNLPADFPDDPTDTVFNFPSEFFYWIAESDFLETDPADLDGDGNTGRTGIRFAVEGAFLNELPASGDQMVFGRIRVTANELAPNSVYTVTHPYGVDTYETNDLGIVIRGVGTEDIGCVASLCDFSLALPSRVFGAFLRHTSAPEGFLGDAISLNPIVGSPTGNNFFRIEGPGLPDGGLETPLFTVSGKILLAPPPPPEGCVDSAPDQPQLVSPANGVTEVSTNPVVTWNALASFGINCLGGRDQFEIFLDQGVLDPTTSQGSVLSSQTSFNVVNLLPSTTYSWKVRASNLALSTDSEIRTFTTTATQTRATSPSLEGNGFPTWYQDDNAIRVVACLDGTDPICVLPGPGEEPGFDPAQQSVLPGNFPSEFFYWIVESDPLVTPGDGEVNIRYAVEGAFLGEEPVLGDQMVFGRIRVRATGLLPNETYTATHAYGVDVYNTDENGIITAGAGTEDIGCFAGPCNFAESLASRVFGGFLRQVAGAPVGYLGDGVTPSIVTGSPSGQNFFRIEGPGLPEGGLETNLFTVSGKLFEAVPPGPDVIAPTLLSFSSTTADGTYGPGAEINITANFSEPLAAGSTAIITLDNTVPIELVQLSLSSTTLVGTYTVGALGSGQDSPDLTVVSISFMNATDLVGNLQTSTLLPASNIANTSDIVINTITPVVEILGGNFTFSGTSANLASSITALETITINIDTNGGTTSIIIPAGTVITAADGSLFDSSVLTAADVLEAGLSGLAAGVVVDGALQFGIPALGLNFSQPITINFFIGTAFNGQTLNLLRSVSGGAGWTSDGIVAPATCTVAAGFCSFQTTKASFFASTHTVVSAPGTTTGTTSSTSSTDGGSASAPVCNDAKPGSVPTLLSAVATGANEVTLTWTKASDPVTGYMVAFGLSAGDLRFGDPSQGSKNDTSRVIKNLSGGTTYFFRVKAANGCNASDYSNEIAVTASGSALGTTVPSGFQEGILGAQTGEDLGTGTGGANPEVSPSPSSDVQGTDSGNVGIGTDDQSKTAGAKSNVPLAVGVILGLITILAIGYTIYRRNQQEI